MSDPGKTISPLAEAAEQTMLEPVVPPVAVAELDGLRRDVDPNVGRVKRPLAGGSAALVLGAIIFALGRAGVVLTYPLLIGLVSGLWAFVGALFWVSRAKATNTTNRNLIFGTLVVAGAMVVGSVLGMLTAAPLKFSVSAGFLIVSTFLFAVSVWAAEGLMLAGTGALAGAMISALGDDLMTSYAASCGLWGGLQLSRAVWLSRS